MVERDLCDPGCRPRSNKEADGPGRIAARGLDRAALCYIVVTGETITIGELPCAVRQSRSFCASCLLSTSAYATGFDLREFSASSLGTSYAGAGANGQHASTMPFNPALAGWVEDFDISVSAIGVVPTATGDFTTATTSAGNPTAGTTTPSSIISQAIIPDIAVRKRLSDQFSVGVSVTVPWGLMTKYSDTWAGRYYATKSELMTYNITPVVAYQPVPELSIAVGMQAEYITGNLGKAIDFGLIGCHVNCTSSAPPGVPFFHVLPGHDDGSVTLKANNWAYGLRSGHRLEAQRRSLARIVLSSGNRP